MSWKPTLTAVLLNSCRTGAANGVDWTGGGAAVRTSMW